MVTDCSCFAVFIALLIMSDKSKSNVVILLIGANERVIAVL